MIAFEYLLHGNVDEFLHRKVMYCAVLIVCDPELAQ